MRLIKLSTDEFPEEADLQAYFTQVLPNRQPPGLFRLPRGWIGEDGLDVGETLLFSYRGRLRFVGEAETGRMDNTYLPDENYPYCFVINMRSARRANVPLNEVEQRLRAEAGLTKSLQAQGWTRIPDSDRAEQIIKALVPQESVHSEEVWSDLRAVGGLLRGRNPIVAPPPVPDRQPPLAGNRAVRTRPVAESTQGAAHDRSGQLQVLKLVLEIIAVTLAIAAGIIGLIWRSK